MAAILRKNTKKERKFLELYEKSERKSRYLIRYLPRKLEIGLEPTTC